MTEPTDAELETFFVEETGFSIDDFPAAILGFARAVLDKWGQPAHSGEPVAWRYQDARGHYRYRGYVPRFDKDYALLKPIPLYTSPQPVREPLTPERIEEICLELRDTVGCGNQTLARAIEAAHGITGGQT